MSWVLLISASTILYAVVTLVDRAMMARMLARPGFYLLIGSIAGVPFSIGLAWISGDSIALSGDAGAIALGLTTGAVFGGFTYLYFRSLQVASPVGTVLYMQLVPFITAVASIWVLREPPGSQTLLAILALCVGFSFLSLLDPNHRAKAARFMVPAAMLLATAYVLQKLLLQSHSKAEVLILNRLGALALAAAVYTFERVKFSRSLTTLVPAGKHLDRRVNATVIWVSIVAEGGSVVALALAIWAYNTGPFAAVSAMGSLLPLAVLAAAAVTRFVSGKQFWAVPETATLRDTLSAVTGLVLVAVAVFFLSRG